MNQAPVQKRGLFGRAKQQQAPSPDLSEQINSLSGRIRMLEDRLNNLNRKVELDESNIIESQKKETVEFKTLNSEILELKRAIEEIREKIELITTELPNLAARDELEVIKKYVEMWDPMSFVTRAELEKALKQKLEKK